jgi:hypothetical protein
VPEPRRVYSEGEAAELLKRAAELQEASGHEAYQPGVTWDDLVEIAKDAGIDQAWLERATIASPAAKERHKGLLNYSVERVVEGELPSDKFDVILETARPMRSGKSQPTQVGKTLQSRTWMGWNAGQIEVSSRKGRTRIKVGANAAIPYLMAVHIPFVAAIISLANLSALGLAPIGLAIAGSLLLAAGFLFQFIMKKSREQADQLVDRIAEAVAEEAVIGVEMHGSAVLESTQESSQPISGQS